MIEKIHRAIGILTIFPSVFDRFRPKLWEKVELRFRDQFGMDNPALVDL
jgi:hypothetical protein